MADNQTPGNPEKTAGKGAETTAQAGREAGRASEQATGPNIRTAQQAMLSGVEAGARGMEGLTQSVSRAFGIGQWNGGMAEQSAQNMRAISQASTVLARGAQEASRAWFDLAQNGARTNLEALGQLASCRTVQDVVAVQSNLVRENLQQLLASGEAIARASTQAMQEATRVIRPAAERAASRPA